MLKTDDVGFPGFLGKWRGGMSSGDEERKQGGTAKSESLQKGGRARVESRKPKWQEGTPAWFSSIHHRASFCQFLPGVPPIVALPE